MCVWCHTKKWKKYTSSVDTGLRIVGTSVHL